MKEPCLKASLPGDLYERSGQWWWRTRLPGEMKAKARQLKTLETGEAVRDRDTAEKIAVRMWEQAVREDETTQITRDCAEKVERLKAQFLDKVRQLTAIVESANAKAEAEVHARAEIEARLNAMIRIAGQKAVATCPVVQAQDQTPSHIPEQMPAAAENSDLHAQTGICECCGAPEIPVADLEAIDSGQLLCPDCIAALHTDVSRIETKDFSGSRV